MANLEAFAAAVKDSPPKPGAIPGLEGWYEFTYAGGSFEVRSLGLQYETKLKCNSALEIN